MEIFHKYVETKQYSAEQPMGQRRNQKKNFEKMKMEINISKIMRCNKSTSKTKVHSTKCLYQDTRKTLYLKKLEKRTKPELEGRKLQRSGGNQCNRD